MHRSMKPLAGALALALSACAVDSGARAPSRFDPSQPDAPESPVLDMAAMLVTRDPVPEAPPAPAPSTPSPRLGAPADSVYACPMHPEVTSHEPGRCPKCGMTLVLQEPPRGQKP